MDADGEPGAWPEEPGRFRRLMQRFQVVLELAQLLGSQTAQALLGREVFEHVFRRSLVQHCLLFFRCQTVQKLLA
jgi:hypothetical protein